MYWKERAIYLTLIVGVYCIGRWQSENRELLNRGLRAKEFSIALQENRIGDIEYRLQDDINVCTYNSYTAFSFGPDLWQRPLPKEKISLSLNPKETTKEDSLDPSDSNESPRTSAKSQQTFITEPSPATPTETLETEKKSPTPSSETKSDLNP